MDGYHDFDKDVEEAFFQDQVSEREVIDKNHMNWLVKSKRTNVHPNNEEGREPCDCFGLEMLASIQVSFRVLVCRLRTNKEFKLRVLIYRTFTVFLIHFTYKLCVSRAFLY